MAVRKIVPPEKASSEAVTPEPITPSSSSAPIESSESPKEDKPQGGVTFAKNQVNELIKFEDGTTFQFLTTRQTITDPKLIANLREQAERSHIIELE